MKPQKWLRITLVTGVLVFIVCAGVKTIRTHDKLDSLYVSLSSHTYRLEVAQTEIARTQGLGGRDNLPKDAAMLFIFDDPREQCIWMKDMRFAIDIVWLNTEKQILQIKEHVSPDTYPQSFCANDTKYVLELPSGSISHNNITVGQQITF